MTEASPAEFYAPTHRFSAAGFTIAVIGGAAAAAALGFAYGCVQVLMPILYLCFLVTILFATVLGHLSLYFVKLGHVRHRGGATAAVLVAGVAGLYGAWAADRLVRLRMAGAEGVGLSFAPGEILRYIEFYADNGFWTFRGTRVYGLPLIILWVVEAGIVFTLSTKTARTRFLEAAYCEACRRWTKNTRGVPTLMPNLSHGLSQELLKGNLQPLHQEVPTSPGAPLSLRVDLDQCAGCASSVFLSMRVVAGGTRFREFVWPEEKMLVRQLRIAPAEADALRAPPKLAQIVPPGKTRPPKAEGDAGIDPRQPS